MTVPIARRKFVVALAGAATWPLVARAQQGNRVQRIGALIGGDENDLVFKSRLSGCCARAASGHVAAPASATTNFRRAIGTVIDPAPSGLNPGQRDDTTFWRLHEPAHTTAVTAGRLLMGWSGRAPTLPSEASWAGAPKTKEHSHVPET